MEIAHPSHASHRGRTNERNQMKTIRICTAAAAAVALLSLAASQRASGNDMQRCPQGKDPSRATSSPLIPGQTLSVKGLFFTRNFSTATDCKVSFQDKPDASLAELRPGQKVYVRYERDNGVLIATADRPA